MTKTNRVAQSILDVSIDLFASNGFRGTSVRDIGKAAGTTMSNIYYHFGNKEGLLLAILDRTTRKIVETLRQVTEQDIDPVEKFRLLLKTHLGLLLDVYERESKILFLDEEQRSRITKDFQIEILDLYREELQRLRSSGLISHDNITLLTFNILAVIIWHTRWYKADGKVSLDRIGDQMVNFVLYGAMGVARSPEPV